MIVSYYNVVQIIAYKGSWYLSRIRRMNCERKVYKKP